MISGGSLFDPDGVVFVFSALVLQIYDPDGVLWRSESHKKKEIGLPNKID
jgi:hypothetical protein